MGIRLKRVNAYGAKFYLEDSKEELARLGEAFSGDVYEENENYYEDDDIVPFLEEVVFNDTSVEIVWFGNTVCDTKSDPMGIIISPKTEEDKKLLKDALSKINKEIQLTEHQEIKIG